MPLHPSLFRHPEIATAREYAVEHGLLEFYDPFRSQWYAARRRGIPFDFTFAEWVAWWQTNNRWARRGLGIGKLVMARNGDT